MEQWVDELFSDDILQEAFNRYDIDSAAYKDLGGFENYVFEVYKGETPYILRLTHSSHRDQYELEGELQWVNYLQRHNVNVSLAHKSNSGKLVEKIKAGETSFFACLFDKAPGRLVKVDEDLFGPELFAVWGETIGNMHRVTRDFNLQKGRRSKWEEDDLFDFPSYLDEKKDGEIISQGEMLVDQIKRLPQSYDSFGLIHSDVHPGNFFYHEGEIHVFDFDDSTYHFYVSDIAIPLYYSVWWKHRNESLEVRSKFGEEFFYHFLKGYQKESAIDPEWIERIPMFLRLRDLELYTVLHKKWDMSTVSPDQKQLVAQIRDRLIRGEEIAVLPYKAIVEQLPLETD
ncbi:phosphotransferase enzyme family protein [Thalassobacillus sp. B23F22_16]|uniref:phosphotransferase enzyme family protein n=1 Tax=Thalassobacillus sp. B23F22_16 TaxID=3459513 RepID=UPI00373E9D7F